MHMRACSPREHARGRQLPHGKGATLQGATLHSKMNGEQYKMFRILPNIVVLCVQITMEARFINKKALRVVGGLMPF